MKHPHRFTGKELFSVIMQETCKHGYAPLITWQETSQWNKDTLNALARYVNGKSARQKLGRKP